MWFKEAKHALEERVGFLEKESPKREDEAVEAATAPYVKEAERLRDDVSKLRRELLSRTAREEEIRGKLTVMVGARDVALAGEQAANGGMVRDRAESEKAVAEAREAAAAEARALREMVSAAEARANAAESNANVVAQDEQMKRDAVQAAAGEQGRAFDTLSEETEALVGERAGLQDAIATSEAENARLNARLEVAEQERATEVEELLLQVELWEAEANRLGGSEKEKEEVVAQVKQEAEQLYSQLGALSASADETQAQLSSRARKAEAEVVRLRLQVGQVEDSADAQTEEQEQTAGRHLAELRGEVSRLMVAESEARALADVTAARVAELEMELAGAQDSTSEADQRAAAAGVEADAKIADMAGHVQSAKAVGGERAKKLVELEEQVVSLSSQLVSGSREQSGARAKLEGKLTVAMRDNGKFVSELSALRLTVSELRSAELTASAIGGGKDKQIGSLTKDVLDQTQQIEELERELGGLGDVHSESHREQAAAFESRVSQLEEQVGKSHEKAATAVRAQSVVCDELDAVSTVHCTQAILTTTLGDSQGCI